MKSVTIDLSAANYKLTSNCKCSAVLHMSTSRPISYTSIGMLGGLIVDRWGAAEHLLKNIMKEVG